MGKNVRNVMVNTLHRSRFGLRQLTAPVRMMPDFIILGVQRAGTTSLYEYLIAHPDVGAASKKEVHFFDRHYTGGIAWYRAHFPPLGEQRRFERQNGRRYITGEASPYYLFHPDVPARIRRVVPEAKFLVLLRNPIDRALSHYHHNRRLGMETLSFEEALDREEERLAGEEAKLLQSEGMVSLPHQTYSYQARGAYAIQLERWFALYPREQFCILDSEYFYADTDGAMAQVFRFLSLPEFTGGDYEQFNAASYATMNPETRRRLQKFFAPHNAHLERLLGRAFDWD